MIKDIPSEAAAAIAAFEAEELARKKSKPPKGESKKDRQQREKITSGTVFRPAELLEFALRNGWKLINQEGSHRKLENEEGETLIIPARAGQQETVQPDTNHRILKQIFPGMFK